MVKLSPRRLLIYFSPSYPAAKQTDRGDLTPSFKDYMIQRRNKVSD
jgi:hypothetical protein